MNSNKTPFRKRQLRTTVLLLLILALSIGANLYVYNRPVTETMGETTSAFDIQSDIRNSLERYAAMQEGDMAEIVSGIEENSSYKIGLAFTGITDNLTMLEIIRILKEYKVTASFYFSGLDATANAKTLNDVMNAGYEIGSGGYTVTQNAQYLSTDAMISDFCQANRTLGLAVGIQPTVMLLQHSEYTDKVRALAYACYITKLIKPSDYITYSTFRAEEEVKQYITNAERGSIVCLQLSGAWSAAAQTPKEDTGEVVSVVPQGERNRHLLQTVEWIAKYIHYTDYSVQAAQLIQENEGKLAEAERRIHTVEKIACYTFSELGETRELLYLLTRLDQMKAKSVFFLTKTQLERRQDDVREIMDHGHEIGIAVPVTTDSRGAKLVSYILETRELLLDKYEYQDVALVRQSIGNYAPDSLREAASATGLRLLSSITNATRDQDMRATDANAVLNAIFPKDSPYLQRGHIVHFRLGVYRLSSTLLGDLAYKIRQNFSIYPLGGVTDVMGHDEYTYTYPLPEDQILPQVKDKIYPGQLVGSVLRATQDRYFGVSWIDRASKMPGFTSAEVRTLDRKGLVANKDNAVFLTFDDWGTDKVVNDILDVLAKYNARGTFFIVTQNVVYNPNLLRAIAVEGHTIASHTNSHMTLSVVDENDPDTYLSLTQQQADALADDLVASYDIMQSIVGDIIVDGKPALSRLFRPPTLAVSKIGMGKVFDCGFTYSISGNYSTGDYMAKDAETLAKDIKKNLKSGAVIVMHISPGSIYTAQALQIVFSQLELNLKDPAYVFARLSDYLN